MQGKVCLVTGSTSGIGKATAEGLAKLGATVLITGRAGSSLSTDRDEIASSTSNGEIYAFECDLASMSDVRKLAAQVKEQFSVLDVLINNAGSFQSKKVLTVDGFEMQFAVNHLSHFLLTNLLLPELRAAAQGRIIHISSGFHYRGKMHFDNLNLERYDGLVAYAQSKLANVLFSAELARRLNDTNITSNSLHPGRIGTNMGDKYASGFYGWIWNLVKPFLNTPEKGAQTSIYLASSPDVTKISGSYFAYSKQKEPSRASKDLEAARQLWEVSTEMTGMDSQQSTE
ncbi:MAG: SDR family oxidoreductase [Flavobacteriales bacterium]|nr:SDR family oxidoreductase [Flavobacteriales bacterium]